MKGFTPFITLAGNKDVTGACRGHAPLRIYGYIEEAFLCISMLPNVCYT